MIPGIDTGGGGFQGGASGPATAGTGNNNFNFGSSGGFNPFNGGQAAPVVSNQTVMIVVGVIGLAAGAWYLGKR